MYTVEELKEKRIAFLEDTIAFYGADPKGRRSQGENGYCLYRGPNGTKCAIGRFIPDNLYDEGMDSRIENDQSILPTIPFATVLLTLPDEVKLLGSRFLGQVQNFHDNSNCWNNEGGLSAQGEETKNNIIKYINTQFFDI